MWYIQGHPDNKNEEFRVSLPTEILEKKVEREITWKGKNIRADLYQNKAEAEEIATLYAQTTGGIFTVEEYNESI